MNKKTPQSKPGIHKRVARKVLHHAKHWFIPHEGNEHRPHALRTKALKAYAYVIIAAKISSIIFLFAAYPNQGQFSAFTSNTIISLTNASRQEQHLNTLQPNALLTDAATRKAKDMIARNYFAHTTPDGKRFWTWIDATGYNYSIAGENLAIDFTTPESAHSALMASPTHRENIMNSRYKEVGVAVVTGKMDGELTTVLVEMFGTKIAKKTPVAKVTNVKAPKPTVKPTTTTPKPKTTPKKVKADTTIAISGNFLQQSTDRLTLQPQAIVDSWAEFKNTGEGAWKANTLSLVTVNPAKRQSAFVDSTWTSNSIIGDIETDVAPGDVARIEWKFKAPTQQGSSTETFALAKDDGTIVANTEVTFTFVIGTATTLAQTENTPTQANSQVDQENPAAEVVPQASTPDHLGLVGQVLKYLNNFYMAVLFFLAITLLINIFIKIRVQHAHVIGQTMVVIAIAATALLLKGHFLERIGEVVHVLGISI
jgi:uncharacterized protein YkwD